MLGIPEWMSGITFGQVAGVLVGIGALVGVWNLWLGKFVKAFKNFSEDWFGIPDRPGVPGRPGVMATLYDHGRQIAEIKAQVTPNHGSQLKLSEEVQSLRAELQTSTKYLLDQIPELVRTTVSEAQSPPTPSDKEPGPGE